MSIFTKIASKASQLADSAYRYVLPKSSKEYAKYGAKAVGRLLKDLAIDAVSTLGVACKSFLKGLPAGVRSSASTLKGFFWDLPKVAYYKYQQNETEEKAALQQAREDFSYAGNQFVEAVSIGVNTAYEDITPILSDAASSIFYNGGQVVLDTGAIATIALVETGKVVSNNVLIPVGAQLADKMGEVVSALETLATEQASLAYKALLPSPLALLPKFTSIQESCKPIKHVTQEIEMSVMNVLKATAIAAA